MDAGSQDTVICGNTVSHNALQGIKVQGPNNSSDHRATYGTEICRNTHGLAERAAPRTRAR